MTTFCEVVIFDESKSKSDEVVSKILEETKRLERKYNYFNKNSYLSSLNKRKELILDFETKDILKTAKNFYKKTDKIFDITVATFKEYYKVSKNLKELENNIKKVKMYIGCEHFQIKRDKLYFDNPYTKLDLGGFVKEYSVDKAVKILKKNKIKSALVNFGGDIFAIGKKPDGKRFKIGIKNPKDTTVFSKYLEIQNQALATSASYERGYKIGDKDFSHILAKEIFYDCPNSVTVISQTCLESGVFSTALMINPMIKTINKILIL